MTVRVCGPLAVLVASVGAAAGGQPAPARPVSPDNTAVLAEGPLEVKVFLTEKKGDKVVQEAGTLLFVTRSAVYYRAPKAERVTVRAAKDLAFAEVTTADKVATRLGKPAAAVWTLDPKADPPAFKGDALPAPVPDLTPKPTGTPLEQNWFLFHALARLQGRAEAALAAGDKGQLDFCRGRAAAVAQHMADHRLDKVVAAAYADLPAYLDRQVKLAADLDALYADQLQKNRELIERAREAEARRRYREAMGWLTIFGSALQTSPGVATYSDGRVESVELADPDVFGIADGILSIGAAKFQYQNEMSRLAVARQAFQADAQRQYTRLYEQLTGDRERRAAALRDLGAKRFQLDPAAPLDRLPEVRKAALAGKSLQPVVALYKEQAEYERGTGPWDNPFAVGDWLAARARAAGKNPAELAALAREAAEAVRLVPPGEVFAPDRTDLVRAAAVLACRAAAAEAQSGYWCRTYSPRAAVALRLLDAAGPPDDGTDPTGEAREQRAVALLLVGRVADALDQALAVEKLRATSGGYHYTVARLYSARFLVDEANGVPRKAQPKYGALSLQSLKSAFRYGFHDVRELKASGSDSDFFGLFVLPESKDEVARLTRVGVSFTLLPPAGPGGNYSVRVVNESAFTVTAVAPRLEMWGPGNRPLPAAEPGEPIPLIRSGKEARFEVPPPGQAVLRYRLVVGCDQGKDVVAFERK